MTVLTLTSRMSDGATTLGGIGTEASKLGRTRVRSEGEYGTMPSIDHETGRDLLSFLSGEYTVSLCDGAVELHCTCLPGDTVSAAAEMPDGVLHLFVDLNKPDANRHAREMLRTWLGVENAALAYRTFQLTPVV